MALTAERAYVYNAGGPVQPHPHLPALWTFYDGLGWPIQTQMQAENGWLVVQDTAYDALGRPATVTLPCTAANLDGPPYAVAYGYDQGPNGIGRRTAMTDTTGSLPGSMMPGDGCCRS